MKTPIPAPMRNAILDRAFAPRVSATPMTGLDLFATRVALAAVQRELELTSTYTLCNFVGWAHRRMLLANAEFDLRMCLHAAQGPWPRSVWGSRL